jgi:copper chaperone CopZ
VLHPRAFATSADSSRRASGASAKIIAFLLRQYGVWAHHINMTTRTVRLSVLGMTCYNCTRAVERTLASTPGVIKASVDLEGARATVEYDVDLVNPEVLADAVRDLGYEVAA